MELIDNIRNGLNTGFIDGTSVSIAEYQPDLIVNDSRRGSKLLTTLAAEMRRCEEFFFCVAFITNSGVQALLSILEELEAKGVRGKIIASQYQNFTEPLALKRLAGFKNIELRILTEGNLHSKGYVFRNGDNYTLIIGSSNLTQDALGKNNEWNLRVTSFRNGALVGRTLQEFQRNFENAVEVTQTWIDQYSQIYLGRKKAFAYREAEDVEKDELSEEVFNTAILRIGEIKPNKMQVEALQALENLRKDGKDKALLISATGTGKTYLSAFDARKMQPRRLLFIIHRENIAKAAMMSFKRVFYNSSRSFGMLSGRKKEIERDFLFTTIQTLSKDEVMRSFAKDYFDYIILDEAHHGGAETYKRVLDYFEPKFLLGMTATPERTDGFDIFKRFDYNIAYEIRLQQALEEDMLCPFHYFGVTDVCVEDEELEEENAFLKLTSDERVKHILEKSEFYGCDDGNVRCLVFCSRNDVSAELANKFNALGIMAICLTGEDSPDVRESAIQALESNDSDEKVDYVFTRDIFNEGVDIPRVNQIIMLRPTQSAIVFVQQLGRGLRKRADKEYLTVIDFIGNYKNNYLVPIALFGDSTYNKDRLRRLMVSGNASIPGASTINFDSIARQRIYDAINNSNLTMKKDLQKDFELLKYKIGRIPMMMDFVEHGSRDPMLYVAYSRSLYNFVCTVEKDFKDTLSAKEKKIIELVSSEIANGKRVEEPLVLSGLLSKGRVTFSELGNLLMSRYGIRLTEKLLRSIETNLNFLFTTEKHPKKLVAVGLKYGVATVKRTGDAFYLADDLRMYLQNPTFAEYLKDTIQYGIHAFDADFDREKYYDGFVLYKKYSRKDVFRILCWDQNPVAQNVGGYIMSKDKTNCPIFVTYEKSEDISESIKYEDRFLSSNHFQWMSKNNRTMNSPEIRVIMDPNHKIRLPLFIKKNDDEGMEFYFIGDTVPLVNKFELQEISTDETGDSGKKASIVKMELTIEPAVERGLMEYLMGGE